MSNYKYGDWFCRPETEAEAAEIVRLAIASGADNEGDYEGDSVVTYGVKDGEVDMYHTKGTEYTLPQLRTMFGQSQWNGEGLPPVGTVCELSDETEFLSLHTGRVITKPLGEKVAVAGHATRLDNEVVCVVIQPVSDMDCGFAVGNHELMVNPLRTKREKWIEAAMLAGCLRARDGAKEVYGNLYDAGLAKDIDE